MHSDMRKGECYYHQHMGAVVRVIKDSGPLHWSVDVIFLDRPINQPPGRAPLDIGSVWIASKKFLGPVDAYGVDLGPDPGV